jgi:catechol 2,3-dioxygenase-like lactoylglutathione lyase family enzyme
MAFWHKKILTEPDYVSVDVVNIDAARQWYEERLGLNYSSSKVEEADVVLGYSEKDPRVYLCRVVGNKRPNAQPGHPQILLTTRLDTAHEFLASRGVDTGPIQTDSGGNRFFRFRDLEGNELEVCQHA